MEFDLTPDQIERYARHILLKEVGGEGQRKLLGSRAFVVGAGGLGAPALLYLAAAGVGELGVVDADQVELSNLHRQVIHGTGDLGRDKTASARATIADLNPDCEVRASQTRLRADNVADIVAGYDVVLDGSDNFPTRFLVADFCWMEGIPLVSAAILRFEGHLMTVLPGPGNPCYRCQFPEPPPPGMVPSCQEAGVLGAVAGVMGCLQAGEALKLLLGVGDPLTHTLLVYDALATEFRQLRRRPDPECALCGPQPTITAVTDYDYACVAEGIDDAHHGDGI